MAAVAPVVDHVKRSTIQEIASKSPFNIFNIVAIVAILVIGYFLYRKFSQKFALGAIRMPDVDYSSPVHSAPVEAVAAPVVPEPTKVEEAKED